MRRCFELAQCFGSHHDSDSCRPDPSLHRPGHAPGSVQGLGTVTSLNDVDITLDGTGTLATSQLTSFTAGQLTLSGGNLSLANLTDADNSDFIVSAGPCSRFRHSPPTIAVSMSLILSRPQAQAAFSLYRH